MLSSLKENQFLRQLRLKSMAEMYLLLLGGGIFTLYLIYFILARNFNFAFIMVGGVFAFLVAFLGGTRFCFPLYYATTFGAAIYLPGLPVSLNKGLAALLFLAGAFDLIRYRKIFPAGMDLKVFLINIVYITLAASILKPEAGFYPVQLLFYMFPFFLICMLYWRLEWLFNLFRSFLLVTVFVVIFPGILEFLSGMNYSIGAGFRPGNGRPDGLAKDAIVYSFTAMWMIPMALFFFSIENKWAKRCYYGGVAFFLVFVSLITLNRQTPIIMAGMFATQLLLLRHRHKALLMAGAASVSVLAAPLVFKKLADRFSTATNIMMDHSLMFRRDKIVIASEMWKEHWLFGVGHNHFHVIWRDFKPKNNLLYLYYDNRAHFVDAGYIQIFTEYGLIGSLLFVLLVFVTSHSFVRAYRLSLRLKSALYTNLLAAEAAMFAQFFIANIISDVFMRPRTIFLFAVFFATTTLVTRAWFEQQAEEASPAQPREIPG